VTSASMNAAKGQQDLMKSGIGRRKRKQDTPIIVDLLCPQDNEDCLDNRFFKKVELATAEMDDLLRSSCTSSSLSDEKLHVDSVSEGTLRRSDSVDMLLAALAC
jgi:hypothetical protein